MSGGRHGRRLSFVGTKSTVIEHKQQENPTSFVCGMESKDQDQAAFRKGS